jgi:predicted TIM-barrel fold metal-dependent hydrolase
MDLYRAYISGLSASEQAMILSESAARIYKL